MQKSLAMMGSVGGAKKATDLFSTIF